MGIVESAAFLKDQLAEQIHTFDSSRQYFRKQQFRLTMATAVLSSATTILIATGKLFDLGNWISLLALLCSASITVASAYDQFLRSRELWIQRTDAWMELQILSGQISYAEAKYGALSQHQIDEFNNRRERIVAGEHGAWKRVRAIHDRSK